MVEMFARDVPTRAVATETCYPIPRGSQAAIRGSMGYTHGSIVCNVVFVLGSDNVIPSIVVCLK